MSEHNEDILQVANPIRVDESPVQGEDDEILLAEAPAALDGVITTFGEPANLACKEDMISTPEGTTAIGWAADEDGNPVSGLVSNLTALDPDSGNYETVILNTDPADDNILIGTTETGGNVAFVAVIVEGEDGLSSDVYLLDYLPKEHPDGSNPDDTVTLDSLFVNVAVSETVEFDFAGAPSGNTDFMAFGEPDGVAVVVTGRTEGETVNASQSGNEPTSLALNSNNINAGEGLVVTYVNDMEDDYIVPDLTGPEASDPANIQFASLQTATEGSVTIVKVGPGNTSATVHLTAWSTEQEEGTDFIPGIGDDVLVDITDIQVNDEAWDPTQSWSFTIENGEATIEGITNNDTITFVTDGVHNRVVVENGGTGNARFNLGGVAIADVNEQTDADPVTLAFDDDAPGVGANATVQLDDDALANGNPGGVGDDPDAVNTTGTLAHDFGADGPGSIAWLTSGAPSGFSYALNGDDLEISQDGVGVVLTLTVDADGNYTATQNQPVMHAAGNDENNQAFTVGYRVTDKDTDFVDGSIVIDVDDDTPEIALSGEPAPALEVDESDFAIDDTQSFAGLFSESFGADGPGAGGGLSYALSVTDPSSGLTDTLTGQPVTLALDGAAIVGSNDDGDEVFRLTVDGAGNVTLDQSRAVVQPDETDPDDLITLAAGKVGLTATATDADVDSAELTVDISTSMGFRDDAPAISGLDDTEVLAFVEGASDIDSGFLDYGADGEGDFVITDFTVSPTSDSVLGTISGSVSPDGTLLTLESSEFGDFFQVSVDGSGTGSYAAEVLQNAPVIEMPLIEDTTTPGGPKEHIDLPEDAPFVTLDGFLFTDPNDTSDLRQTYLDGDLEEPDPDASLDDINISKQGAALFDNQFDFGEGLALNFQEDVAGVSFIVQGGTGAPGGDLTLKMAGYNDGAFVAFSEETFTLPKGNASQEVEFLPGDEVDQVILIHDATDNGWRMPEIFAFTFADIPDIQGTVTVEASDGDEDAVADTFTYSIDGDGDGLIA